MELHLICQNISQLSKQLTIIQDYITLKFGLDFQEFCKNRSSTVENSGQSESTQNKNLTKTASTTNVGNPNTSTSTSTLRNTRKRTFEASSSSKTFTNASNKERDETLFLDSQSEISDFDIIQIKEETEEFNMGSFIPGDDLENAQSDDNHSEGDDGNTADSDYTPTENADNNNDRNNIPGEAIDYLGQFDGEPEVVASIRGKNSIHLAGYRYLFNKKQANGTIAWVCDNRRRGKCYVRIVTSTEMTKVIKHSGGIHNHEATPEKSKRIKQISLIKNLSVLSTDDPSVLLSSTFSQLDENDRKILPRRDSMKRMIRKTRQQNAAAMPVGHILT